jgi:hypothetical protein
VRKIGSSLEVPAAPAFDQLDPAPFVMSCERLERSGDFALADVLCNFIDRHWLRRCEKGRFDGALQFVHQAALSLIDEKASS